MGARLRSWWQKIKQHPYIAVGIVVALLVIIAFTLAVHVFGWDWTGFTGGESKITITSTSKGITTAKELQPKKVLWDWLGLLAALAIPVVVGIGAAWFTVQQAKVSDRENKDNQLEAALQAYIDKISELLLKEQLGEQTAYRKLNPIYDQVRKIARVRTISILAQLDARRIGYIFTFLREAGLMSTTSNDDVVSLQNAVFYQVNWSQANLQNANLSEAILHSADLTGATLYQANLSGAILTRANLSNALLYQADLSKAILIEANLSKANLFRAKVTEEQLKGVKSLKGATMPDGSIHR